MCRPVGSRTNALDAVLYHFLLEERECGGQSHFGKRRRVDGGLCDGSDALMATVFVFVFAQVGVSVGGLRVASRRADHMGVTMIFLSE